ncbi:hypothetical protein BjapCC829_39480 [Bradyrhizobium barranii]|uniref:Twin-arginine translocation signal domain-containing protein n=1 Tax=Bradyrhizobium barranii TaxID=2992140 RepID=A0ABY3QIV5_9BRAD|nr:hypothetical protein [Bradyrhizobium japonicum]UFW85922.1 hypothetical protein BjapCC829_39480 [Bradyrhizobium japonicum]
MNNDDNSNLDVTGVSRRSTLTLAAGVAALGVALGMRSNAYAQGKGEGKMEGKGEGKVEAKVEGKGEGKGEGKAEGKGEGKAEGKGEGKEGRREGKAGRIRVDIDGEGTTTVDVRCADDEPMRACADLTKEIVDKIRTLPVKR